MTIAPVMLFTYSRPEHTRSVLNALEKNDMADKTPIYAYTCGPKNDEHAAGVYETQKVLKEFLNNSRFLSFEIVDAGKHLPLGTAMIEAVSNVVSKHGKVIVVEDDVVTSKDFLRFMNDCLNYYEKDPSVFTVCGYSPDVPEIRAMDKDVYIIQRVCPWGWGIWKDRWDSYDPEIRTYIQNILDRNYRRMLVRWTADLPLTLDARLYEKGSMERDWEQPLGFCQFKNKMNTICPKISKVKNIGFDGSGTHFVPIGLGSSFTEGGSDYKLEPLTVDPGFQKRYNRLFIFKPRTKIMVVLSNFVHYLSPRAYYKFLNIYYHNQINIKELMENKPEK
ncbi:MAG: hypothetical protein FWC52_05105 [Candidatus Methanoplasma sp.]|nr:hypothetical protein [Candidatus Methanoplasma sp.]